MWNKEELDFMDKYQDLICNYREESSRIELLVQLVGAFPGGKSISKILVAIEYLVNGPDTFSIVYQNGYGWLVSRWGNHLFRGIPYNRTKTTARALRKDFEGLMASFFGGHPSFIEEIANKAYISDDFIKYKILESKE